MGVSCNRNIHLNYTDYQNISGHVRKGSCSHAQAGRPPPLLEGQHSVPEALRAECAEQSLGGQGVRAQVLAVCVLKGSCRQAGWAGVSAGQEAADTGEAASGSRTGAEAGPVFASRSSAWTLSHVPEPLPGLWHQETGASPEAAWGDAATSAGLGEPQPHGHALCPLGRGPCSGAHEGVSATSH